MTKGFTEGSKYLEKLIADHKIPGCEFALVTKDHVESMMMGNRQSEPVQLPVESNTLYDLASLTKVVVTSTLSLQLLEEEKISLETSLSKILEDFPYSNITLGMLLCHASGLPEDNKDYKQCKNKEELYTFIKKLPLESKPGTKYAYSDFGYILLGMAIEKITGESLDRLAHEKIFVPLHMNNTLYKPKQSSNDKYNYAATEIESDRGLINGIVHDGKAFRMNGISGNAGLFSNIEDVSIFTQMFLNNGCSKDGIKVLDQSSISLLKEWRYPNLDVKRTVGWFADEPVQASFGDYYSKHCLYHTGFTGTSIYIDFDRKMGIVLLTNSIHPTRERHSMKEARSVLHNIVLSSFDQELS